MDRSDGFYWYKSYRAGVIADDWTIVFVETIEDPLAALAGLSSERRVVRLFTHEDPISLADCEATGTFEGPLERSAVPGLTTAQLQQAIADLHAKAQGDSPMAEAFSLAAEALAVVESTHE